MTYTRNRNGRSNINSRKSRKSRKIGGKKLTVFDKVTSTTQELIYNFEEYDNFSIKQIKYQKSGKNMKKLQEEINLSKKSIIKYKRYKTLFSINKILEDEAIRKRFITSEKDIDDSIFDLIIDLTDKGEVYFLLYFCRSYNYFFKLKDCLNYYNNDKKMLNLIKRNLLLNLILKNIIMVGTSTYIQNFNVNFKEYLQKQQEWNEIQKEKMNPK
jgi:hypothetical protein